MPEGFIVGLTGFNEAKAAVDKAVTHYEGLADELDHNIKRLRDNESLMGGHGVTGHFQNLLAEFGREWLHAMDRFIAEERAFVAFLRGFATRLGETHDDYLLAEARHTESFEDISRSISER